jgi:hypothetical protein
VLRAPLQAEMHVLDAAPLLAEMFACTPPCQSRRTHVGPPNINGKTAHVQAVFCSNSCCTSVQCMAPATPEGSASSRLIQAGTT